MKANCNQVKHKLLVHTFLCVLILIIAGCSGPKKPGQPFIVPFDSKFITTEKRLTVSPALETDGSKERSFLSITQQSYFFENKNCTAKVEVMLNRKAKARAPEIGEWSTVSTGNCLSNSTEMECFTAHIDCHLVRTTYINTGKRSIAVIKVRNSAREPQELCERWDSFKLTADQLEEVNEFNRVSDSFFTYKKPVPPKATSKKAGRKKQKP